MMPLFPIAAAAVLLGLVAGAGSGVSGGFGERPSSAGLDELDAAMAAAGLPDDWQVFLAATAYGESRWHSDVALGPNNHPGRPPWLRQSRAGAKLQQAEAKAAAGAYDHNRAKFASSPFPEAHYTFGSAGYFGMLPAYGIINGFRATPEVIARIDPWDIADPAVAVVMAVGFARGLMAWKQFAQGGGTWLTLRVGWGRPASMKGARRNARVRKIFAAHLHELGVDPSFMDRRVSPLDVPKGIFLLDRIESRGAALARDELVRIFHNTEAA